MRISAGFIAGLLVLVAVIFCIVKVMGFMASRGLLG